MRVIVTLSGGKASAWCAKWAFEHYAKSDIILYFNDTHWEHPDLYRFLTDLEKHFNHPITRDSDERSPEDLFYDKRALANNRMPFCSAVLKAERLQKYYQDGDILIFGIGLNEQHRAVRLKDVYYHTSQKSGKACTLRFPLIENPVTDETIQQFLTEAGVEIPLLYRLGFKHNNCSGGCVRATIGHWTKLYHMLPEVYAERERVEMEVSEFLGRPSTIMPEISLKTLRERLESQQSFNFEEPTDVIECIGICDLQE
ncbi:MAG: phosphoadenosine phosphosulfate reductase family protein [Bryobacteraceae bacterium]